MSGYIGTQPVPQATQTRDSFTATSGQTSFATGGYTPNFLDVYLNGVKLASADYTASNGSDVVLASGAATGDILEVVAFTTFNSASSSIDDNGNATAITINASESVLVGKSVDTLATSGTALFANGQIDSSVDGNYVAKFNRKSSDGTIIELRKDTTGIVGSIGVVDGDNLFIGSSASDHAGFYFNNTNVKPYVNGAVSDNTMNIGASAERFKDIFISGGIHLGGTGSANKLEDFETGHWTPTLPNGGTVGTVHDATYVKVGNLVTVYFNGDLTPTNNSSAFQIGNLPFSQNNNGNHGGGAISYVGGMDVRHWSNPLVHDSSNKIYFHRHDASSDTIRNAEFGGGQKQFIVQIAYMLG